MNEKLLIIIATGDREKALTALMFAISAIKYEWIPVVRVVFFGPAQNLLVSDSEVASSASELSRITEPMACKFLADRDQQTEPTEQLGIKVEYVGEPISQMIRDEGFIPMVW